MAADDPAHRYARVIVDVRPAHLDRPFDYLVPDGLPVAVGSSVRVSFAGRRRIGWVVGLSDRAEADPAQVRPLDSVLGSHAWFDEEDLRLYRWVARRYAGTLADVLRHALPARVAAVEAEVGRWTVADATPASQPPCASTAWRPYAASALLRATGGRGEGGGDAPACWLRVLPGDDPAVLVADLVARTLSSGRSALVLAPDPASPLPDAAREVAGALSVDLRTDVERHRYRAFLRGRVGSARVAVGERSAVFAPLASLGLVVVDDEANPAYKERRSPRHHVREVALARARMAGATCVLLGDLPSAALWRLLGAGHVTTVAGDRATERARAPRIDVADLSDPRPDTRRARFTTRAAKALGDVVDASGAAVVLAARGGQGSALACRSCRRRLTCPQCAGSLAASRDDRGWRCPACAWEGPAFACPDCGSEAWSPLAAGAGRLAAELGHSHPTAAVARMEGFDAPGPSGRPAIGVLTRGSVVTRPGWLGTGLADAVVVPDADALLGRPAVDAAEDALRLLMAVARWTRRMVVQTREPNHPAVQALVRWDAEGFWEREAAWRGELRFPPAASLVALRAPDSEAAAAVVGELSGRLPDNDEILGPDVDGGLLVKTSDLHATLSALTPLRATWALADRKIRVDVDPLL